MIKDFLNSLEGFIKLILIFFLKFEINLLIKAAATPKNTANIIENNP